MSKRQSKLNSYTTDPTDPTPEQNSDDTENNPSPDRDPYRNVTRDDQVCTYFGDDGTSPGTALNALLDDSDPVIVDVPLPTPTGFTDITIRKVAGQGGFGVRDIEQDPEALHPLLSRLKGIPVIIEGGGQLSRMDDDLRVGVLSDASITDNRLQISFTQVKHSSSTPGLDSIEDKTRKLGSYKLFIPTTLWDAACLSRAIRDLQSERIPTLTANDVRAMRGGDKYEATLSDLSPGDRLSTDAYETDLIVISDTTQTDIRVTTARGERVHRVTTVTVTNPRGGYYQFGWRRPGPYTHPTCYLSRSQNTKPAPNSPFTADHTFADFDPVAVTTGDEYPTYVPVDTDREESPLPSKFRTQSLTDLDGIGENTMRTIVREAPRYEDYSLSSAHELAYLLFGDTDIDTEPIEDAIDRTSRNVMLRRKLRDLYHEDIKPNEAA
ncbi:hypothetical protein RYH80_18310 [Halobaculum sp. MBLA0147]|uniref:hypothetical protein n=1 Tax=Halobaculum sp. MBLA0147 TaxID=3079934 RepID=UPI0035256DA1